jgi:prepilin-type processing-associated H-X9-DG protein
VQAAREASRGSQCANNLKNIGLALNNFHAARRTFPAGSELLAGTEHAWSSSILPFLEQESIARQVNYSLPWNAPPQNLAAASQNVSTYVCPSAVTSYAGKQDYGGIIGTGLSPFPAGTGPNDSFGCGTLIVTSAQQPQPVTAAKIGDGLSATLLVGEATDRDDAGANQWAWGRSCFAPNDQWVNMDQTGSLHSEHPGGAQALFADGHVRLLTDDLSPPLLGAICTRNGNELGIVLPD